MHSLAYKFGGYPSSDFVVKGYKSLLYAFSHLQTWKLHKINADKALYCIEIYRNCIKMHQNDLKFLKDVKNASKKLTSE